MMRLSCFGWALVPWIVLLVADALAEQRRATPAGSIRAGAGFRVDLLASAQAEEGSWISMTFDDAGRIVVGLDDRGLGRLTIDASGASAKFERLRHTDSLEHVRGVLYAHDSLYACATNSQGLYRLWDRDADGQFEDLKLLEHLPYQSRFGHGANQIVLGPEGSLYVIVGNDVVFPGAMAANSPYKNPRNDWLLPSPHDAGQDDRVGYVARLDAAGENWTVLAGGFRNPFDIAFNREGEMFTWDADMEWDAGLPWYRPTRLNHVIRGGEYGWRWGTGKWPAWYPDSLPTTLDTGYSSPTGMVFGHLSNWPARFREGLFMADWQLGRILLVDLIPNGSTYSATMELFLEGGPLNVCDLTFGPDGAMYFITGGRGSQSGLYRVTWVGEHEPQLPLPVAAEVVADAEAARRLRKRLEVLQQRQDAEALDFLWEQLGSEDQWLRFSARVALENQPLDQWRGRVAAAPDGLALRTALLALARVGEASDQPLVLSKLEQFNADKLSARELLLPLRTLQLSIIRQGLPTQEQQVALLKWLHALSPQESFAVNWLLTELLVRLESPAAMPRTLDLLERAATQEEQIQFAKTLSRLESGWDDSSSKRILAWLHGSRGLPGGKLVETTWHALRADLEARIPEPVKAELSAELARLDEAVSAGESPRSTQRPFVRAWTVDDLIDDVNRLDPQDRALEAGQQALAAGSCLRCHRLGERGSPIGPDLTHVSKRFDGRALLESVVEPSRQVDPKYSSASYLLIDGQVVSGRTVGVSQNQLTIEVDPLTGKTQVIDRDAIEQSLDTVVSPMPTGLLDTLTRQEILNLIALLRR